MDTGGGHWSKWVLSVTFDREGHVVDDTLRPWTMALLPGFLSFAGLALLLVWLWIQFGVPIVFGIHCPECTRNPLRPVLMHPADVEVYHGGFDSKGISLAPIIERTYTCPQCGFLRIRYLIPSHYRDSSKWFPARTGIFARDVDPRSPMLNEREQRWYDQVIQQHERTIEGKNFETYEQWKEYFLGLKARERDENGK